MYVHVSYVKLIQTNMLNKIVYVELNFRLNIYT